MVLYLLWQFDYFSNCSVYGLWEIFMAPNGSELNLISRLAEQNTCKCKLGETRYIQWRWKQMYISLGFNFGMM